MSPREKRTRTPASRARSRARDNADEEASMAVTWRPRLARKIASLPSPHPSSSARPAGCIRSMNRPRAINDSHPLAFRWPFNKTYDGPLQPEDRRMDMRRALISLALAAAFVLGGFAAYVYLYEGELDVRVQDAVGDWAHVDVTFTEVWAHEAGKADDVGWHNVTLARTTVDLASFVNISGLLANARFAPGKYTQIRILVSR